MDRLKSGIDWAFCKIWGLWHEIIKSSMLNYVQKVNFHCWMGQFELSHVLSREVSVTNFKCFQCIFNQKIHSHKLSLYLHDKRFRCRLTGHSCRKSHWFSPHIDHCSGRGKRSYCSGRGSRVVLLVWSSPSPPGPGSHRWAAENGCIPGSLFVWMQYLLQKNTNTTYNNLMCFTKIINWLIFRR